MKGFFVSLLIGSAAGLIDIAPMVVRKLDSSFIVSAFLFWLVLGIVIPKTSVTAMPWLNGIIAAVIASLPLLPLIWKLDPKAVPAVIVMTVILGAGTGLVSNLLFRTFRLY